MRFRSKSENDSNFLILFIHQENTCKSFLHSNFIILTDFHSFTVNEGKLRKQSIFKFSAKVSLCDLGQNSIMTESS